MRKLIGMLVCFLGLVLLSNPAVASIIDLTTAGSSGSDGIARFYQMLPSSTGTGLINSFVRIQRKNTEQGYNTSGRPVPFDENSSGNFTRDLLLGNVPLVTLDAVPGQWREFLLDVNESSGGNEELISLDKIEIYLSNVGGQTTTNVASLGTLIYSLDHSSTDRWIKLDYSIGAGSGSGDMFMYIPNSLFTAYSNNTFVYLYSQFGLQRHGSNGLGTSDGFEEWAVRKGAIPLPPPVPEPGTLFLLGTGLLSWAMVRRYRK